MDSLKQHGSLDADNILNTFAETEDEKAFRQQANFGDIEKACSFPLLAHRNSSYIDMGNALLSRLNPFSWNPFVRSVNKEGHEVWLLDNTAYRESANSPWQAKFTAAYFEKDTGEELAKAVSKLAWVLNIADDSEERETIAKRLEPFLNYILPAHHASIELCGGTVRQLNPSNFDGISYSNFQITGDYKDGETCDSTVKYVSSSIPCTTTFASVSGWAVISDIDDTIKITGTGDPKTVLQNTFVEEPQVVPGMPQLYKQLETFLKNPPFWYLSASPYVLYPFLRAFRKDNYPDGTMQLRETSLMNLASLLTSLTAGVKEFKVDNIEKIYKSFPKRKVICFGDSTQSDPESYAEIYRRHPGWVAGIFIRKVEGQAVLDLTGKNRDHRFEKAFEGIPREDWMVFTEPSGVFDKVQEIYKRKGGP